MNDPKLNECLNAVRDFFRDSPTTRAAVIAIVEEAHRQGYFKALKAVEDNTYLLRVGGSA